MPGRCTKIEQICGQMDPAIRDHLWEMHYRRLRLWKEMGGTPEEKVRSAISKLTVEGVCEMKGQLRLIARDSPHESIRAIAKEKLEQAGLGSPYLH